MYQFKKTIPLSM